VRSCRAAGVERSLGRAARLNAPALRFYAAQRKFYKRAAKAGEYSAVRARLPAPQQQRIGHHAHARQRHRRAGHHRAQQPEGRERNAGHVVGKGPEQVLPDLRHRARRQLEGLRHQREVAAHQRDAGGFHRHVGAAARGRHGNADVGRGQCGRIVGAVADHRDDVAVLAQRAHLRRLVGRQHVGAHVAGVDAQALRHRLRRAQVVAGDHHHAQAARTQRAHRLAACGLGSSAKASRACTCAAPASSKRSSADTVAPCDCRASTCAVSGIASSSRHQRRLAMAQ
jgi:hypothetical protein